MEGNIEGNNNNKVGLEKKARPQEQLNCPRCNSTNTKFCYYNNYSLTQPRYFCKTCRRYWTEGGSLRNVPVGGGSRKNKKLITTTNSPSTSSLSSAKLLPDLNPPSTTSVPSSSTSSQNPKMLMQGGQDLNLAFPPIMENYDHHHHHHHLGLSYQSSSPSSTSSSSSSSTSALMLLRAGMTSNNHHHHPFVHNTILMQNSSNNNALFPAASGFNPMHEVKPGSLGFSMDDHHRHHHQGLRSRYGVHQQENDNINAAGGSRLLFPFGDVKQIPGAHHEVEENNKEHAGNSSSGYWTGMIGEGSW